MPRTGIALLCLCFVCGNTARGETQVLQHLESYLSLGYLWPTFALQDKLQHAPTFGGALRSPYYGIFHTRAEFHYSLLDEKLSTGNPRRIHYLKSGIGLEIQGPPWWPGAGVGLSHHFVRSTGARNNREMLLDANESEFGFYPYLQMPLMPGKKAKLLLVVSQDVIFSKPDYTFFPTLSINLGWAWW